MAGKINFQFFLSLSLSSSCFVLRVLLLSILQHREKRIPCVVKCHALGGKEMFADDEEDEGGFPVRI